MKKVILADNQDLTKAGWLYILNSFDKLLLLPEAKNKADLFAAFKTESSVIVIFDYTQFDFVGINDLLLLESSYPQIDWIICSDDLSEDFMKMVVANTHSFSLYTKSTSLDEIRSGLREIINGNRYICNYISNTLLQNSLKKENTKTEKTLLTATEKEILKDIASGKTTKEIAALRYISIHTVMTHRKNIFRKIDVNNIHEATKYAMRAGLIDLAEYYI